MPHAEHPTSGFSCTLGTRSQAAHSVFELQLSTPAPQGEARSSVAVQMGAADLSEMLNKLDTIQAQMDKLA